MFEDYKVGDIKEVQTARNGQPTSTAILICKGPENGKVRFEMLGGVNYLENGMFEGEPWQYVDETTPMKSREFSTYAGAFTYVLNGRDHNRNF